MYLVQKKPKDNFGAIAAAGVANRIVAYGVVTCGLTAGVVYLRARNIIPSFATTLLVLSWAGTVASYPSSCTVR